MNIKQEILKALENNILVIDGAMGTQIQDLDVQEHQWIDDKGIAQEGCNELLNDTAPEIISTIHRRYAKAGADLIKTNTF
ncbi:MAG: homocysteine S-methyltransferase family protein, partial [Campylobacterota bacterium]|nr:homocysteine S-methyltransferase family protein [Campylobacterota bacterium]